MTNHDHEDGRDNDSDQIQDRDHDPEEGHEHDHDREDEDGHEHGDSHDHHHDHDQGHEHDYHHEHDHHHHDLRELGVAVLTVSSSRSLEEDPAGDSIVEIVEAAGHVVAIRELVNDSYDGVQNAVDRFVARDDVDCVVSTGGTGVTPDDVTVEAVEPLFDKELPGFGELFRTLSYDEIGTRIVGTRAVGGVCEDVLVFCLPGSENAARLGAGDLIVEEAPHLAGLARREE